jgi:hypothetical protein
MPSPNNILPEAMIAASGTTINKFSAVKATSNPQECTLAAATADLVVGICQEQFDSTDTAAQGKRAVNVMVHGISRAVAGGVVARGARVRLKNAAAGKLEAIPGTTTNAQQVGIAMSAAAADGDHFDVLLTPGVMVTTP